MTQFAQATKEAEDTKPPLPADATEAESAAVLEDVQDLDAEMSALSTRLSQALTLEQGGARLLSLLEALFQFLREITQSLIALLTMARLGELANSFGSIRCVSNY